MLPDLKASAAMLENLTRRETQLEYAPENAYRLEYSSSIDGLRDWAIVCPGRNDVCIVKLHGHGSHGDQLFTRKDIKDFWLGTFLKTNSAILSPNLRDNAWMSPAAVDDLSHLLEYMRSEHNIRKFILCSGSMGATGNLIYSTRRPQDVHACIALGAATDLSTFYDWCMQQPVETTANELGRAIAESYGCKPQENPKLFDSHSTLKNCSKLTMPVFFAHGESDRLIPVGQARQLSAAMQDMKNFRYMEIADGNHDSPCFLQAAVDFLLTMI